MKVTFFKQEPNWHTPNDLNPLEKSIYIALIWDWGWCLGGASLLANFQARGAYRGGAYKKKRVWIEDES